MTSGPQVGSQSALREANSQRIADAVRRYGAMTQVEIAAATGLSQATVSTIVKQLLSLGLVNTRSTIRSGRRAQLVMLARSTGIAVGVHIGHRSLRVALAQSPTEALDERVMPLPPDHRVDTTLDRVALLIADLLESQAASFEDLVGVCVALPAPVDPERGQVAARNLLRGWEDTSVAEVLGTRIGAEVLVDNDANLAVLAESRFGAARGASDAVFVRASYATGAGLLVAGRVHRGRRGTAGEIGHTEVDPEGAICQCGSRGCLNTVVGADALIDRLRVSRGPMTLREVVREAQEGDPGCRQVVAAAGAKIGAVVAGLALSTEPEVIVVGGELAMAGEVLVGPLRDAVRQRVLLTHPEPLRVSVADLGQRAEVVGAIARALDASPMALTGGGAGGAGGGGASRAAGGERESAL